MPLARFFYLSNFFYIKNLNKSLDNLGLIVIFYKKIRPSMVGQVCGNSHFSLLFFPSLFWEVGNFSFPKGG